MIELLKAVLSAVGLAIVVWWLLGGLRWRLGEGDREADGE